MALALTFWRCVGYGAIAVIAITGVGSILVGRSLIHDLEHLADDDE